LNPLKVLKADLLPVVLVGTVVVSYPVC
jgi:hypothetical protein